MMMTDAKQALILCHYDTVWPVGSLATHPFRIEADGKAYGPGIFDMQTSLMLSEYRAARRARPGICTAAARDHPHDLGRGGRQRLIARLIEAEGQRSAYVLVLESPLPGGVVKTERKGGGSFAVEITGRAAHAGVEPEKGINAIHELAHQILAIQALTDWDRAPRSASTWSKAAPRPM